MMTDEKTIPVFFSCDDRYLPFLAVAVRSLIDNLSPEAVCSIHILNQGLDPARVKPILDMANDRVKISLVNVSREIGPLAEKLNLRDYYTLSIYYRLFIASLFPQYHKAIYLDADITVNGDLSTLYAVKLGNRMVGAVSDDIIASHPDFIRYTEDALGIPYRSYFNSGVMLMNLDQFRIRGIERKFVYLLNRYHFDTICPDQDYLNVLCKDKVLYLNKGWNKMSIDTSFSGTPDLIHFNMFFKPWQYDGICYADYFWDYARRTTYYEEIREIRNRFGWNDRMKQRRANRTLHKNARKIAASDRNFRCLLMGKTEFPEAFTEEESI